MRSYVTGKPTAAAPAMRSSERQMIAMLFLVTLAVLILTTPQFTRYIVSSSVNYTSSPQAFASFFLFVHVSNKMFVTNYSINFFLYVISGKKFRSDMLKLIFCSKRAANINGEGSSTNASVSAKGAKFGNHDQVSTISDA